MTPPDPGALAALHGRAFQFPRPWSAIEFAALLADRGVLCHSVTGPGGGLAGFGLIRVAGDEAELLTLAVEPAQRRHGHGRALLQALLTAAREAGAERVFLEVADSNAAARALYAAAGFHEAGRRRGYFRRPSGPPVDALVLCRPRPGLDATR